MINDDNLNRYLISVLKEKASSSKKILSLFEYGFLLNKSSLKDLQVHNGFQKTIQRYIEDKERLTTKEILAILRLYSLEFSELVPVFPPEVLKILFAPNPIVELDVENIEIIVDLQFIPKPIITLNIDSIPLNIEFIPKAIAQTELSGLKVIEFISKPIVELDPETQPTLISYIPKPIGEIDSSTQLLEIIYIVEPIVEIETQAIPLILEFVSKPIVELDLQDVGIEITSIPKSIIELDQSTVTPPAVDIEYLSKPWVEAGVISSIRIDYLPKPITEMQLDTVQTGVFYYGYSKPTETNRDLFLNTLNNPTSVQSMINGGVDETLGKLINKEILAGSNTDVLEVTGWNYTGAKDAQQFAVFLLPTGIDPRTTVTFPSGTTTGVGPNRSDGFELISTPITIKGINYFIYLARERYVINPGTHKLNK